jgi:hypothetical protein
MADNTNTTPAPAPAPAPKPVAQSLDAVVASAAASGTDGGTTQTPTGVIPFNFAQTQRDLAFRLVWILIGIVGIVTVLSVTYSVDCWAGSNRCTAAATALGLLTSSISPIFTAMIGLVGSVVGFYFGSKQNSSS